MRGSLLLLALITTSTACTPMPPKARHSTPGFPPRLAQCQPDAGQAFLGQVASEDVIAKVMAATGASSVRVIKPGMAVTMDFRDDRLNLDVDADGVIVKVHCG